MLPFGCFFCVIENQQFFLVGSSSCEIGLWCVLWIIQVNEVSVCKNKFFLFIFYVFFVNTQQHKLNSIQLCCLICCDGFMNVRNRYLQKPRKSIQNYLKTLLNWLPCWTVLGFCSCSCEQAPSKWHLLGVTSQSF